MAMDSNDLYSWLISNEGMPAKVSKMSGSGVPSADNMPTQFTFYIDNSTKEIYTTDLKNGKWIQGLGGGALSTVSKNASFTLDKGSLYLCDVSANSIDITMPTTANLVVGDTFEIMISVGDASINNVTLLTLLKSQHIEGNLDNFIFDVNSYFKFIWIGDTTGWKLFSQNGGVPNYGVTGEIKVYPNLTPPMGYLSCQGQTVSRTTYSDLFKVIGIKFGAGDGTTSFGIPNGKGRMLIGYDSSQTYFNMIGNTGGSATHIITTNEMPSHSHTVYGYSGKDDSNFSGNNGRMQASDAQTPYDSTTSSVGLGQSMNILNPYLTINYIIKY